MRVHCWKLFSFLFVFRFRKAPNACRNPHIFYQGILQMVPRKPALNGWFAAGLLGSVPGINPCREMKAVDLGTRGHWTEMKSQWITAGVGLKLEWPQSCPHIKAEELGFRNTPNGKSLDAGCPSEGTVTFRVMMIFNRWQFPKKTKLHEVTMIIPRSWRDGFPVMEREYRRRVPPYHPLNCAKHTRVFPMMYLGTASMRF